MRSPAERAASDMGKGAILSGLLHLTVLLLAVFGLPWLYNTNEVMQATPITVISEAQFAELKNQKPPAQQKKPDQPKDKEIPPAPKAPDVAQPEPEPEPPPEPQQAAEPPPQPQQPPPPEPPQQAEQQQPAVQPEPPPEPPKQAVAPEPPPQPKPEPVQPPEPQVAEAQPKPVPPKKPTPPKKEPKKPEPKERSLDDIINGLANKDKDKKTKPAAPQQQPPQQAALPQDNYDGPPVTEGEKDAIRQQVHDNWIIDVGMQGLADMTVEVKVRMNPDGSVVSAKADPNSSNGHPNWPIYARSCENAVLKSSPLRMPPDKPYQAWATMTLVFNARQMLNGY